MSAILVPLIVFLIACAVVLPVTWILVERMPIPTWIKNLIVGVVALLLLLWFLGEVGYT